MKVLEITESIHGELPLMGMPCTIIRLEGCNLKCPYCDTKCDGGEDLFLEEILDRVTLFQHQNILITGGEPLISIDCKALIMNLTALSYDIVLETNGTVPLPSYLASSDVTVVMDVKLFKDDFSVEVMNLKRLGPDDSLKFVYENEEQFNKAVQFLEAYFNTTDVSMVIFSPIDKQNVFFDKFMKAAKHFSDFDFRMQTQIHKVLNIP